MNDFSRVFRAMWLRSALKGEHGTPAGGLAAGVWCARVSLQQHRFVATDEWTAEPDAFASGATLAALGDLLFDVLEGDRNETVVLDVDGATAYVWRGGGRQGARRVEATVAGPSKEVVTSALDHIRASLPKQVPRGQRVEMKFWSCSHAPSSRDETLDVCSWEEIANNYAARTRRELSALMHETSPGGGKLVLWLGPPGTGKTFALRALAFEQRERIVVHYILDPDAFLRRVEYVMAVFRDDPAPLDVVARIGLEPRPTSRLIVLEDAGELLGIDAMERTGQGLARLLNLTDGLAGQGTRTRVLITTNEDVGRLHPAVTRPGRCGALVRFDPLDEREVAAWWRARGREALERDRRGQTIADLFGQLRGEPLPSTPVGVGFGATR